MQQARDLGRYPKESTHDVLEQQLANKLRKAKKANQLSHAALKTLQRAQSDERPMKVDMVSVQTLAAAWLACPTC